MNTATRTRPELLKAAEVAKMLNISARHLWRLRAARQIPAPVQIGGSTRWKLRDLVIWLDMGCCSQQEFEARTAGQRKRR
ncbi:MAG: AlpA family transcriptional regulator [Planctomycetes bacterium B3_Pla]|nr:MAG: AlpA family transcriptional regulator [Planctomycetes bacterium B3_Pla]